MGRLWSTAAGAWLLMASAGCVYYGMDVEGKSCGVGHACPPGYQCVGSGQPDGGTICRGTDGGTGKCEDGEKECSGNETQIAVCVEREWDLQECGDLKYCFDADGTTPAECRSICAAHADCTLIAPDYYCDTTSGRCLKKGNCTEPGFKCDADKVQLFYCDPDTGIESLNTNCGSLNQYCYPGNPGIAQCRSFCDDDRGCQDLEGTTCNPHPDKRQCVPLNLCTQEGDCTNPESGPTECRAGECSCEGGACTVEPGEICGCGSACSPDLECYGTVPSAPPLDPPTCNLEGMVVFFFNLEPVSLVDNPMKPVVQFHALDKILTGIEDEPEAISVDVSQTDIGTTEPRWVWKYTASALPTNRPFVLDVHCDEIDPDCKLYPLYTFVVLIRADECPAGTVSLEAPAIYQANYSGYTVVGSGSATVNTSKGLLFGRLKDCHEPAKNLEKGTGGVSMPKYILYYLPPSGLPQPTVDLSTRTPGLFAAANVTPIRGVASALVEDASGLVSLGTRDVRVFPMKASLVLFEKPKMPP